MKLASLVLIILSVTISALAQVALKAGMTSSDVQSTLSGSVWETFAKAVVSLPVLAGLAMYAIGAILWLYVLARVELTVAYPFVGLGFVLTALLGVLFLNEPMSALRVAGTALVVVGVALVGLSR